jgi:hypothetical protein
MTQEYRRQLSIAETAVSRLGQQNGVSCRNVANALSSTMTVGQFENGYWYADQLKHFAERIGIPAAKKLRKDELEQAIVAFLRTGKAALPTRRSLRKTGVKDVDRGLGLDLRIEHYTSNRETKQFIVEQARRMAPDVREKSGVWYRLNRWREEQITSGRRPTYRDLVRRYILLNKMPRFERVPHGRYINFVADFLKADKKATRAEAIAAWLALKKLDLPKDYASWAKARAKRGRAKTTSPLHGCRTSYDISLERVAYSCGGEVKRR